MNEQNQLERPRRTKTRGEHKVTIHLSYETKENLRILASKYDRPVADIIRTIIRIGIPMMDGLSQAEEVMVREYVQLFRTLRKVKALKDI